MSQTVRPKDASAQPGYPARGEQPAPQDASRRRFLRQLAAGTAATALAGLPRLSHGQSLAVDFSKLDRHAGLAGAQTAGGSSAAVADALEQADDAAGLGARSLAAPADSVLEADSVALSDEPVESLVEEQRALWVEPGYLVLVRWERPDGDDSAVAAFEGAADQVATFLTGRVDEVDDLHNLERLHPVEHELQELLQSIISPARIILLHLDHDCTHVCSALNPSRAYPERFEVMGDVAAPGWE